MEIKTCSVCKKECSTKNNRYKGICASCYHKKRYERIKDKRLLQVIEWRKKNPQKILKYNNKFRKKKLEKLAGRPMSTFCEACGNSKDTICFDHNHKTGNFRGWLCFRCNTALGLIKDNPETLFKLIKYLHGNSI